MTPDFAARREMIAQYKLSELASLDLGLSLRLQNVGGGHLGSGQLVWMAAKGAHLTVSPFCLTAGRDHLADRTRCVATLASARQRRSSSISSGKWARKPSVKCRRQPLRACRRADRRCQSHNQHRTWPARKVAFPSRRSSSGPTAVAPRIIRCWTAPARPLGDDR